MSTQVHVLDKSESVYKAIKVMADKSISTVVTSHKTTPVGILTERDLVKKLLLKGKDAKNIKIQDIMTKDPVKINQNSSVLKASNVMRNHNVRKLVVINHSGDLVGIISQTDIIKSMYRIEEAYSSLIWNPWFSIILVILVLLLFFLNYVLFRT
jgi:CBS domain-containing protein